MNYEALDAFGINLSANTLENSEFVKSLGKSWNQLSDNEKMMAAYMEITRQGSAAQGLAAQEADSFGMKMKLLKEELGEAAGKIGEQLLPMLTPLIEKISEITQKVVAWVEENPKLTATILAVVGIISALFAVLAPIVTAIGMGVVAFGALSGAAAAAGLTIGGFIATAILPVIAAIAAVIAIVTLVALAIKSNFEDIKAAGEELKTKLEPIFQQISDAFSKIGEVVKDVWDTLIQPVIELFGELIEELLKNWVEPYMTALANVWTMVADTISWLWNDILKPIITFVGENIAMMYEKAKPLLEKLGVAWDELCALFQTIWEEILKPVLETVGEIITKLVEEGLKKFRELRDKLSPIIDPIVDVLGKVVDKVSELLRWLKDLVKFVGEKLKGALDTIKGFFGIDSKSIDINTNINGGLPEVGALNVPINPIGDVALSGSYYSSRTPLGSELSTLVGVGSQMTTNGITINQDNSNIESILADYLGQFVQAMASFNPNLQVNLDGHKVSQQLNIINGQGMKLNERWR